MIYLKKGVEEALLSEKKDRREDAGEESDEIIDERGEVCLGEEGSCHWLVKFINFIILFISSKVCPLFVNPEARSRSRMIFWDSASN